MQINTQLNPEFVGNEDKFNDPFFSRFNLRRSAAPLQLSEGIEKHYLFPTFYANVTCAQAIFLCDYEKAKAMLPHSSMTPVRMPGGRALVAFSCYRYPDVMHIGPYNEVAMTIPVLVEPKLDLPVLPMITPWFSSLGYFVFNMPVTSLENRIRGNKIWGLPKVTQTVEVEVDQGECVTRVTDAQGNNYFTLKVPTQGKVSRFDVSTNLYSAKDNQLKQSQTCFKADFRVNKNMALLARKGRSENFGALEIGKGQFADQLRQLDIDPEPFQFRFAPYMNACFDLPNPDYIAPQGEAKEWVMPEGAL